jgi:hypothetical protein
MEYPSVDIHLIYKQVFSLKKYFYYLFGVLCLLLCQQQLVENNQLYTVGMFQYAICIWFVT